ncbi:MAG: glycosyltransferase family 2 protein [Ferroplasma sp.]|uniref:glycosyltransferase family A protein n=1 Tax=Ferroplasma sp. TaxID=2591003 RepID=UPI002815C73B|nr:glycosyltransferase family 2 protein [Ferroplasma sp.]WMT50452.1 MAG: glycosyltransferase family 2 protein [Ferroplasma sp.]
MSNDDGVYISVIVSDYDRRKYIIDALESVLNQSLSQEYYEIILVKNFEDETIDRYALEHGVRSILSRDSTLSGKIYEGTSNAKGNVICFLDDDDMFYKNKLEIVYNKFKNRKHLVYLHNGFSAIDVDGHGIVYENANPDFNMSSISVSSGIIKMDMLKKVSKSIDTLMYLYALESGKDIEMESRPLTYYRVSENSVTHSFNNVQTFTDFSIKSLNQILESYMQMEQMFKSRRALAILRHRKIFTRVRIKLFGGRGPGIGDYFRLMITPTTESRAYEFKVVISSIMLKNYAIKKLYENEIRKKELA